MKDRIKEWEDEIIKIQENQKKMIEKNNEKIRSLRKKIAEEKENLRQANTKMIADIVRAFYGEVTEENVEHFKVTIMEMQKVSTIKNQKINS